MTPLENLTRSPSTLTVATAGLNHDYFADKTHARYPRVDYLELKRLIDTDILNYSGYEHASFGEVIRNFETRIRSDLYLTMLALLKSRNYKLVFTMSERAGIPYAGLRHLFPSQNPFLTMFQCWSRRQERAITQLNLLSKMDGIAVHCRSMKQVMVSTGANPDRVHVLPYSIDEQFFRPLPNIDQRKAQILSVGETRSRNYPALFDAVSDLPVKLMAATSGSWYAREKNSNLRTAVPENTEIVRRLSSLELRQLYAQSQFVVLPIHNLLWSAGATAALEAACMERAVVAFRSHGITDYVIDGETGILVEPGNIAGMRAAIQDLLADPQTARRLGKNARQRIDEELNLDNYVRHLAQFIKHYA